MPLGAPPARRDPPFGARNPGGRWRGRPTIGGSGGKTRPTSGKLFSGEERFLVNSFAGATITVVESHARAVGSGRRWVRLPFEPATTWGWADRGVKIL